MEFVKMHGTGNDFVIVDEMMLPEGLSLENLAVQICDRHFGIGADGMIIIRPSDKGDLRMQILNSDGSEPEMCGNGIRCFSKYAYEEGIVPKTKMEIETLAGIIRPEIILRDGKVEAVKVDMGEPRLSAGEIPVDHEMDRVVDQPLKSGGRDYRITCVSMGNPHCVIFVPAIEEIRLEEWGPDVCTHSAFPRQTNVEFIQVVDRHNIIMRVWERGAGETLACGTGACASVVACVLNGKTDRKVSVSLAGGDLEVEWDEESGRVFMTGPAERVFQGTFLLK